MSPKEDTWMQLPAEVAPRAGGLPPGLSYLMTLDKLFVRQRLEMLEVLSGWETNNKYKIKNELGQVVYYAEEDTDCCTRNGWGSIRPFDLKISDYYHNEIIHLRRELNCDCFPCCPQVLEVYSPPGNLVGTVEQIWTFCTPKFVIKNELGDTVFNIKGPVGAFKCCGADVNFRVFSADGTLEVGKISKTWSGLLREVFTDADNFGISFPRDLDVRMKAVMIGACFLIDFMYFENNQHRRRY